MSEDMTGVWWVDQLGWLCVLDLPTEPLEKGETILNCGEPRRYPPEEGIAILQAEQDQIAARRDELVNEHPGLKSEH